MNVRKNLLKIISRRAREDAENIASLSILSSSTIIFLILKINMKEEAGFLITQNSLRPLRLCVIKFKRIH